MSNERKSNNNLILTKRDLVLLKKSEEVKKVEIYGNLYECLEPYTTLSHKDLCKCQYKNDQKVENKNVHFPRSIPQFVFP